MPSLLPELKEQLLAFFREASEFNKVEFEAEWARLHSDFRESTEFSSVHGPFKIFSYPYTVALFKNAVTTGNQVLVELFFEAKLIDREVLIASLYPETVSAKPQESLFYTCLVHDMHRENPMLFDLCFPSFSKSELLNVIQPFIELHIPTLESLDEALAQKIRLYLLNKPSLQAALDREQLPATKDIFYGTCLKLSMECYKKNLLISAKKGDLERFEKNWGPFFSLYQTYQQKMDSIFDFSRGVHTIFREIVKGGSIQIAQLIVHPALKEKIFNINFYFLKQEYNDEPVGAYTMLALAAFNKNEAMLSFLLDNGALLNFIPSRARESYSSPLAIAIEKASPSMVNFLLEKGITVWDEYHYFFSSPIFAAIASDYQNSKESAYYLTLLLNKLELDAQLKDKLKNKFISDYMPMLWRNCSKEMALWTYRFLLNRSYLNLDTELTADDADAFLCYRGSLLEKVVRLNLENTDQQISKLHRSFLNNNKKELNELIPGWIKQDLFSPLEIERFLNHPIILSYLNSSMQILIRNPHERNSYKNKPLTVGILREICKSLDDSFKAEKGKSARKVMNNIYFYQEIKKFSERIAGRAKSATLSSGQSNVELDADEIEALWVIIEDFKREVPDQTNRWNVEACQWAVKKFCSTSTLSPRIAKPIEASVSTEILPKHYQEKINQIKRVANSLKKVCMDGEAVLAFMEHLITDRSKVEQFFQESYAAYSFQYKDLKEYTLLLHTDNISRGDLKQFRDFINRLIREYIAAFDIASKAGKAKEFFGRVSGACIEGRLRGCLEWVTRLDKLPKFDEVMEKSVMQYRAYLKIMEPDVLEAIKNFPLNDEDEKYDEQDVTQATSFISLRIVGTVALFEDPENRGKWIEKVIRASDVEEYLRDILNFFEDNDFVIVDDTNPTGDFEIVNWSSEDCVFVTAPAAQGFRLSPAILENLLLSYIEGPVSEKYKIDDDVVRVLGESEISADYKKLSQVDKPPIYIFQVTRDAEKDEVSKNLPFINQLILTFLKENPQEKATLLVPMAQCRFHLVKRKEHYVLVEVTIDGVNKEIVIHNSQSKYSIFMYQNSLKELESFKFAPIRNKNYNQQKDSFSCGLFVYQYIQSILELGNVEQLKNIKASLAAPCLDVGRMINYNFSRMSKGFKMREVECGESLPWGGKALKKSLSENYQERLDQLDRGIDFPESSEDENGSVPGGVAPTGTAPPSLFFKSKPLLNGQPAAQLEGAVDQKTPLLRL